MAARLRPMLSRGFTSQAVNGFTGAVGNTPLVRRRSLPSWTFCLNPADSDLPEKSFGEDRLKNIRQSRIPEPRR